MVSIDGPASTESVVAQNFWQMGDSSSVEVADAVDARTVGNQSDPAQRILEVDVSDERKRFMESVGMIERQYRQRISHHGELARLDNLLEDWWQAAIQSERERCAKIAESVKSNDALMIADAIRRGE